MMATRRSVSVGSFLSILLSLAFSLLALALPSRAHAAGTVQIKSLQVDEVDGKWKLNMTINYGATPHLAHIPMIFSFEHTMQYERALTDQSGEKPVLVKRALSNQTPVNESMDVGFSDGTGKVFNITKFDFVIRRDRGFEAGEYTLKIKREGDGVAVGTPQKLVLKGDNPIVDRRAIVFSGEKKKDKAQEGDKASSGGGDDKKDPAEKKDASEASADTSPAEKDPSPETETPPGPPSEPPKQGGCGCRLADANTPSPLGALALAGLAALVCRRRQRRKASL